MSWTTRLVFAQNWNMRDVSSDLVEFSFSYPLLDIDEKLSGVLTKFAKANGSTIVVKEKLETHNVCGVHNLYTITTAKGNLTKESSGFSILFRKKFFFLKIIFDSFQQSR